MRQILSVLVIACLASVVAPTAAAQDVAPIVQTVATAEERAARTYGDARDAVQARYDDGVGQTCDQLRESQRSPPSNPHFAPFLRALLERLYGAPEETCATLTSIVVPHYPLAGLE